MRAILRSESAGRHGACEALKRHGFQISADPGFPFGYFRRRFGLGDVPHDGISLIFASFTRWVEWHVGRPLTFILSVVIVIIWAISGPLFNYSDGWQLTINTGTTIVTFLMVFVIQNTQTRDTQAIQLKLDELIRTSETANNALIKLEERSEDEIEQVKEVVTIETEPKDGNG